MGVEVAWLKWIHVICVILSFSGFFVRGLWMLSGSDLLQKKWVKILPHIIDSLLLGSALLMLYVLQLSVFDHSWLQAKITALLVYIALGMLALKYAKGWRTQAVSWFTGLVVFIYIASVALTKSASGFIEWI